MKEYSRRICCKDYETFLFFFFDSYFISFCFILFSFIVSGFPIALSYPHFYKSHPSLLEAVNGLKPDPKKHESYFYIQPKSGLPVDLAFRFQINMALQEIGHMARVEKFSNFVLPLLWFEIVSIDEYR